MLSLGFSSLRNFEANWVPWSGVIYRGNHGLCTILTQDGFRELVTCAIEVKNMPLTL